MTTKTILSALLVFGCSCSFSQPGLITCNTQNNPDRSLSIKATSQAAAVYTLKLVFSSLNGFSSNSLIATNVALASVNPGTYEVMKFTRDNNAINTSFQYRFSYFPGKSFRKPPDTSFEYLLPAAAGRTVRVLTVSTTVSKLSQELKNEYRGTGFSYSLSDTICATRAGTVIDCSDTVMEGEKTMTVFRRGRNRISIEHRDGTLGHYGITAPIKLLVKTGDEVFPGQPLAVFNKESPKYLVFFSTTYLDEKRIISENVPDNTVYYLYTTTRFYGSEKDRSSILEPQKEYTARHPAVIITTEMTKKEKKKLGYQP